ncbi:unnamed protein product [Effrenium voratum]|nr:unnamed protein product [Effrenium voratum]
MLSWAHERFPNLQWLVRHDDDVYLRAPALLAQLASRPPVRYLWGMFDHGSSPVRDPAHQHYNSFEQFPKQDHPAWGDIFPPYARGLLWAMSADLVAATVREFREDLQEQPDIPLDEEAANRLPHPDDPAVGVLIAGLVRQGMSINLDDRDFNSFSLNPSCSFASMRPAGFCQLLFACPRQLHLLQHSQPDLGGPPREAGDNALYVGLGYRGVGGWHLRPKLRH